MDVPESPIAELRKMVIAQKTALLPPEASDPALQTLHAALEDYDRLLSQAVIAAIQQRPIEVPAQEIQLVRAAAQAALDSRDLPANRELALYQKYKVRLDRIAELLERLR